MTVRFQILTVLVLLCLIVAPFNLARANSKIPARNLSKWIYELALSNSSGQQSKAVKGFLDKSLVEIAGIAAFIYGNEVSATTTMNIAPESAAIKDFMDRFAIGVDLSKWEPSSFNYNQLVNSTAFRLSSYLNELLEEVSLSSTLSSEEILKVYVTQLFLISKFIDHILYTGIRNPEVNPVKVLETFYTLTVLLEKVTNPNAIYYKAEESELTDFVYGKLRHDFGYNSSRAESLRDEFLELNAELVDVTGNRGMGDALNADVDALKAVSKLLSSREHIIKEGGLDGPAVYYLNLIEMQAIQNASPSLSRVASAMSTRVSPSENGLMAIELASELMADDLSRDIVTLSGISREELNKIPNRFKQALILIYNQIPVSDLENHAGILKELVYLTHLLDIRYSATTNFRSALKALKDPVSWLRRATEWLNVNTYVGNKPVKLGNPRKF